MYAVVTIVLYPLTQCCCHCIIGTSIATKLLVAPAFTRERLTPMIWCCMWFGLWVMRVGFLLVSSGPSCVFVTIIMSESLLLMLSSLLLRIFERGGVVWSELWLWAEFEVVKCSWSGRCWYWCCCASSPVSTCQCCCDYRHFVDVGVGWVRGGL